MKLLLDTHAFIWWDSEPEKLSNRVLELFEDSNNTLIVHKDPFDRIIAAQAKSEGLKLVSHDYKLREYPIHIEW